MSRLPANWHANWHVDPTRMGGPPPKEHADAKPEWITAAENGDWLKAAKLAILDPAAQTGVAQTLALIAHVEHITTRQT